MSGHDLSHIQYKSDASHVNDHIVVVVSKWNPQITGALYQGALAVLQQAGVQPRHIHTYEVPGSFELPMGAQIGLSQVPAASGALCLGCVIQGETRHFEFISQAVAQGVMRVGLDTQKPVIFGVLTPDNMQQALDRAGGKYGNKGEEAAVALLEMIDLMTHKPG